MADYPEHEKMRAIVDKSQAIGEFLDWLAGEKEYVLCVGDGQEWMPAPRRTQQLLAEFFGIDLDEIEAEKRAMLAALRGEE